MKGKSEIGIDCRGINPYIRNRSIDPHNATLRRFAVSTKVRQCRTRLQCKRKLWAVNPLQHCNSGSAFSFNDVANNYLSAIFRFWQSRLTGESMPCEDIALFLCLLHIQDRHGFKKPLQATNQYLCAVLSISEPTLIRSRERLKVLGLITTVQGKKGIPTSYHCNIEGLIFRTNDSTNDRGKDLPCEMHLKIHCAICSKSRVHLPLVPSSLLPDLELEDEQAKKQPTGNESPNDPNKNLPSLADVILHGEIIGVPGSECEKFLTYYTSCGWTISEGKYVMDWKARLNWWKTNMHKHKSNNGKSESGSTNDTRTDYQRRRDFASTKLDRDKLADEIATVDAIINANK